MLASMRLVLLLILLPLSALCQTFSKSEVAKWKKASSKVTIMRDKWGVPHIYGKSDADAVFGLLYAQCEDDFERVEMNYISAMGRLAEVQGEELIYTDLRTRLYNDSTRAKLLYRQSPSWLQKLMNAFADGSNYYLATHPEVKPKLITRFQPWMPLLFSEGSIGGDLTNISVRQLKAFYSGVQVPAEVIDDSAEPRGSNGFAIAPSRSEKGYSLLLINPHTSFYFRSEVHMVSEEGLNAYGAVTWGQFFVYQGFNENCGWMHTSTYADAVDEFLETVARRGDSVFYKHDGNWRPASQRDVVIGYVKEGKLSRQTFKVFETHHGPVISRENEKWMTIRMMDDPVGALQQSFLRTKARGYQTYKQVMEINGNSSNNTVFADRYGNIAYWHGNFIPRRDTSVNFDLPVDGSDIRSDWKGYHGIDDIVQLKNPANGWIQNCNSTPFTAAAEASPRKEKYPRYMAPDGQNFRAINADRVLRREEKFTLDELIESAYDPALTAFERLLPSLEQAYLDSPDAQLKNQVAGPMEVVRTWNKESDASSVGATLAMAWGRKLQSMAIPRIPEEEIATHRSDVVFQVDQMIARTTPAEKLTAFAQAVTDLEKDFGTWTLPWGDMNRFQRLTGKIDETFDDARPSLPVGFASSFWGSLAAFGSRPYPGTKKFYGSVGNSFVAVVEFGPKVKAKSIVTGGSSSQPGSRHFNDQSEMYTQGQFKDVLFYREDVRKAAERVYRPGELK
jgi:acyl-homoserine-lactone acylase